MFKKFIPSIHFDHFEQQEKNEKLKIICVDYFELYFFSVDFNNRVSLFCLKTLSKIFTSEVILFTIDDVTFGKLSQTIICYSYCGKIIIFSLDGQQKQYDLQQNIIKIEHDPFDQNFLFAASDQNLDKFTIVDNKFEKREIYGLMNSENSVNKLKLMKLIYYNCTKTVKHFILLNNDEILILAYNNENIQIKGRFDQIDLKNTNAKAREVIMKYDEEFKRLAVFDSKCVYILQINHDLTDIHLINLKVATNISYVIQVLQNQEILNGCFFHLPYFKRHDYQNEQWYFVYSKAQMKFYFIAYVSKVKLGNLICVLDQDQDLNEQLEYQDKKGKELIQIHRWNNHILVMFESGMLSMLKLYQQNQWEKLDFQFQETDKNEIYQENEDEFDEKIVQNQRELDMDAFKEPLYDPFELYIKILENQ